MGINRYCLLYGIGSLGGALTVIGFWLMAVGELDWGLFSSGLVMEDFYAPVVWGGLAGLLYLVPTSWGMLTKGVLFSLVPATVHLFHKFGWMDMAMLNNFDLTYLTRPEALLAYGVYAVCWGVTTAYLLNNQ